MLGRVWKSLGVLGSVWESLGLFMRFLEGLGELRTNFEERTTK